MLHRPVVLHGRVTYVNPLDCFLKSSRLEKSILECLFPLPEYIPRQQCVLVQCVIGGHSESAEHDCDKPNHCRLAKDINETKWVQTLL
jgi:hypothetical protein